MSYFGGYLPGLGAYFGAAPAGPIHGLYRAYDAVRMGIEFTGSRSNTGEDRAMRASASLVSKYADTLLTELNSLYINFQMQDGTPIGPPGAWTNDGLTAEFGWDGVFGPITSTTSSWSDTATVEVVLSDVRIYVTDNYEWRIIASECECFVGGSSVHTTGPIDFVHDQLYPSGCPLFGVPPILTGSCAVGPSTLIFNWTGGVTEFDASVEGQFRGYCQFKEVGGASWQSLNVTPAPLPAFPGSCAPITAEPGTISGTDTGGVTISAHAREYLAITTADYEVDPLCPDGQFAGDPATIRVTSTTEGRDYGDGYCGLWPDLERTIKRWVPADHAEAIYRGGFPGTSATASRQCWDVLDGGDLITPGSSSSIIVDVHPVRSDILSVITGTVHACEDVLSDHAYAPCGVSGDKWETVVKDFTVIAPGSCLLSEPEVPNVYPDRNDFLHETAKRQYVAASFPGVTGSSTTLPQLDHALALHNYANTVLNPHVSFGDYFPGDTLDTDADTINDAQSIWQFGGAPVGVGYWLDTNTQYTFHPLLPLSEQRRTRTSLISATLKRNYLSPWWGGLFGDNVSTNWVGISNFRVSDILPPASRTYTSASSALWTATNGTLAHGANITLTPTTTAPVLELDFGSFTGEHALYPQLAKRIELNWSGATVTGCDVFLVSQSGQKTLIASATGTYDLPRGSDTKHAGTWANDNGAGYVSDTGADIGASGVSTATLASAELVHGFELAPEGQGAKIRFEFTLSGTGSNVTIDYPEVFWPTDACTITQENACYSSLVAPNGPGIRFGQWQFWDGSSILATPVVVTQGYLPAAGYWRSSMLDGRCWYNLFADASASSTNVSSWLTVVFDTIETQTESRADDWAVSFIVPGDTYGRIVYVDSLKEFPPMAQFPVRKRGTDMQPTGAWAQEVWSFCQEPRRYVCAGDTETHLLNPGGTQVTSVSAAPAGWSITEHRLVVTNFETANFEIRRLGTAYGEQTPFSGAFCVLDTAPPNEGDGPFNFTDRMGRYYRVFTTDGNVQFWRSDYHAPPFTLQTEVTSLGDDTKPRGVVEDSGRIMLVFDRDGVGVMEAFSTDGGVTWTTPASSMAGKFGSVSADDFGRVIKASFEYVTGTSGPGYINLSRKEPDETTFAASYRCEDGTTDYQFEDDTFHLIAEPGTPGRWILTAVLSGDAAPSELVSADNGLTWEPM